MPTMMRTLSLLLGTGQEVRRVALMLDEPTQKEVDVSTTCLDMPSARAEILQRPVSSYASQQDPATMNMPTRAT